MAEPDIQYFASSGTWHKPAGAVRVNCVLQAGDASAAVGPDGTRTGGEYGERLVRSFRADELPETMEVQVGHGGRGAVWDSGRAPDGADGYALIVTHLERS